MTTSGSSKVMYNHQPKNTIIINDYPRPGKTFLINTSGSKNCALPIIMYGFLFSGNNNVIINNVPETLDVKNTLSILKKMGGDFTYNGKLNYLVIKSGINTNKIPEPLLKETRISVLLMSIMLIKHGHVSFPIKIGGCNLGNRKYDYHLDIFAKLGCTYEKRGGRYIIKKNIFTENSKIAFINETTTGTENALFFANFNSKNMIIEKAHLCPDVLELIKFMNKLGANIKVNNNRIYIRENQKIIRNKKAVFNIIDDAVEALSYIALGYANNSNYKIRFNNPYKYKEIETLIRLSNGSLIRRGRYLVQTPYMFYKHNYLEITTGIYPEYCSDAQPILAAIFILFSKSFKIIETRFKGRFKYSRYLDKFGIQNETNSKSIFIESTKINKNSNKNIPYKLDAYDIRSAMNAIIVASIFKKKVIISNIDIISRGYANLFSKMKKLGYRFNLKDNSSRL